MKKTKLFLLLFILFLSFLISPVKAQENTFNCVTYFTGVGCSHCAKADPVVLNKALKENPDLLVIEYEIYQQAENASLNYQSSESYQTTFGIPRVVFGRENYLVGDRQIVNDFDSKVKELRENKCALVNGETISFNDLDLSSLLGKPKIWNQNRILIKNNSDGNWIFAWNGKEVEEKNIENIINNKDILKELIKTENISNFVQKINYKKSETITVPLSGQNIKFDNSIEFIVKDIGGTVDQTFTLSKILSLAAVDAVNPCALAVLLLMLIAILTYNPRDKKKVLLAGLAFCFSVFIMYLFYGLVIIKFFQLIQVITGVRIWLYKVLGSLALLLGLLNIKDFFKYKPGRIGTEMPMFLRPKIKKIISGVTSPKGAFVTGLFVTVFLLPCTVGPYVICGGILCSLSLLKAFPWLLLYNLIFIIPMLIITGLVYAGIAKVEDVSGWKDKNIKYLHLVTGIIIALLGLAMFFGWV